MLTQQPEQRKRERERERRYCDMPRMRRSPFCGSISVSTSASLSAALTPLKVVAWWWRPKSTLHQAASPYPRLTSPHLARVACCMTQVQVGRMTFSALTHKIKSNGGVYKNSSNTSQTRTPREEEGERGAAVRGENELHAALLLKMQYVACAT